MDVVTKDGTKHRIEKKQYKQSLLLRDISEEANIPADGINILVDNDVFMKILEFMENHADDPEVLEDCDAHDVLMSDFDEAFFTMDNSLLFRLTAASNYLNMPLLLELCCKVISSSIKEKTTEEIKQYLQIRVKNVKNEVNVQKEYKWIG